MSKNIYRRLIILNFLILMYIAENGELLQFWVDFANKYILIIADSACNLNFICETIANILLYLGKLI
uniref:Uncharacterized protein n=1 Tax=uncultured Alphaproteobacteria bacterium TaxID=91750 RepID=A0A6G8F2A8_9PROT|nr:hypothetical protein PlAlph_3220 [uncultured Alphaproteobacteria bacterium]